LWDNDIRESRRRDRRNAAEVMLTIRELRDRQIALRLLREGIDTANVTGRMIAGVLASLAELELELGRERGLRPRRRARPASCRLTAEADRSRWPSGCAPTASRCPRSPRR
jgi:Resolvase, N terminal domain